jgi:hypothetical protein
MFNLSIPEISLWGVILIVAGVTVKDIVYDRKKLISHKVDKTSCDEHRREIDNKLGYIQGRVDDIYDFLIKRN